VEGIIHGFSTFEYFDLPGRKLARTGIGAVKQFHVLGAASLAAFEVITDGRI